MGVKNVKKIIFVLEIISRVWYSINYQGYGLNKIPSRRGSPDSVTISPGQEGFLLEVNVDDKETKLMKEIVAIILERFEAVFGFCGCAMSENSVMLNTGGERQLVMKLDIKD